MKTNFYLHKAIYCSSLLSSAIYILSKLSKRAGPLKVQDIAKTMIKRYWTVFAASKKKIPDGLTGRRTFCPHFRVLEEVDGVQFCRQNDDRLVAVGREAGRRRRRRRRRWIQQHEDVLEEDKTKL